MRYIVLAIIAVLAAASLLAQSSAVEFEAASIKRNTSAEPARARMQPDGRFSAVNAPAIQFISQAFGLPRYEVFGVPDWANSEGYDLVAKAPAGVELGDTIGVMLQSLLRQRFKLQTHTETRDLPTYDLVLARADHRLGPSLTRASVNCESPIRTQPPQGADTEGPACAMLGTPGRYMVRGYGIAALARILGSPVGRPVIDRTGLTGTWNVQVEFTPDRMPLIGSSGLPPGATLPSPDAPTLFTALEEQLGIKLVPGRGPIEVLVIDHIERPSEN